MNIFWLDKDPAICAKYHNDKHCVKMILEYAQLLSAAHHVHSSPYKEHVYRMTHKGHPCTKYVCSSAYLHTMKCTSFFVRYWMNTLTDTVRRTKPRYSLTT
jgi:hypothetical protein